MTVNVTTAGSGSFADGLSTSNIISYDINIDSSPLLLGDYSGGSSSLSVSAVANTSNSISNSALLVDNSITITDSDYGSISGIVKSVSTSSNGTVDVTGNTIISYLDINVDMPLAGFYYDSTRVSINSLGYANNGSAPYKRTNADVPIYTNLPLFTLKNAIDGYFMKVNATYGTTVDYSGLTINPVVNFPSWSGNFLAHIKELCAIYRIRFWATGNTFYFADISENVIDASTYDVSLSLASNVQGSNIIVYNNDSQFSTGNDSTTDYRVQTLFYNYPEVVTFTGDKKETIFIDITDYDILATYAYYGTGTRPNRDISPDNLNGYLYGAPNLVSTPNFELTYSLVDSTGQYAPSNLYISIALAVPGSTVYVNNKATIVPPGKIALIFTPPPASYKNAYPGPYSLSFEDVTTGNMRSSLFFGIHALPIKNIAMNIPTGLSSVDSNPIEVSSPFIWNAQTVVSACYYASAFYGKNDVNASFAGPMPNISFSNVDNIRFTNNYCKYKVSTADLTYDSISVTAEPATTIADINAANGWVSSGTKTIANLDSKITGMTLSDWSTIPLVN